MIKKVYAFNGKQETLFRRVYSKTLTDESIRKLVVAAEPCNFIAGVDDIVYKKLDGFYVCFVVQNENEMYILAIISHLMCLFEKILGNLSEMAFIYNFKDCHSLLDGYILNGKVVALNSSEVLVGSYLQTQK